MSSTATKAKDDETKTADESEVKPEAIPADTAGELERVKQIIGHQFGIDMRSPGQVAQAEKDAEAAQKELEKQQAEEAAQAEKEAQEEAKAAEATAGSSKK